MTQADIVIRGGRVFYESELIEGGVAISDEKILMVGKDSKLPTAVRSIDARGALIFPGLVDIEASLPPFKTGGSESLPSLTKAAVSGGFTTVFLTPDMIPRVDRPSALIELLQLAAGNTFCDLGIYGPLTSASNKGDLVRFVRGLWASSTAIDPHLRLELMNLIDAANRPCGAPLFLRGIDDDIGIGEPISGKAADLETYYLHRPSSVEVSHLNTFLNECTGTNNITLLGISLPESVRRINAARRAGARLQSAVPAIYFTMTKKRAMRLGYESLMSPPARDERDVSELVQQAARGEIQTICTGHQPIPRSVKSEVVMPGIPTIDISLRIMLTLAKRGHIPIERIPELLSRVPSRILNLEDKGLLSEAYRADLIVVEQRKEAVFDPSRSFSSAAYSPLEGMSLAGQVTHVLSRGKLIYEDGDFISSFGSGKVILR